MLEKMLMNSWPPQNVMLTDKQQDPTYALAPTDGPYGLLDERMFFERNPGLYWGNGSRLSFPVPFNPEVGSACCPEYDSLQRFLSDSAQSFVPPRNANFSGASPVWQFHRFEPFVDTEVPLFFI